MAIAELLVAGGDASEGLASCASDAVAADGRERLVGPGLDDLGEGLGDVPGLRLLVLPSVDRLLEVAG